VILQKASHPANSLIQVGIRDLLSVTGVQGYFGRLFSSMSGNNSRYEEGRWYGSAFPSNDCMGCVFDRFGRKNWIVDGEIRALSHSSILSGTDRHKITVTTKQFGPGNSS
jgi:hypothetical protein